MFNFAKFTTPPSGISPHFRGPTTAGVPVIIKSPGHSSKKLKRLEKTTATDHKSYPKYLPADVSLRLQIE